MEDLNDLDKEKITQYVLRTGLVKAEIKNIELTWEDLQQLHIQVKNNSLGVRVKIEEDGSITPTLTFDTRKLNSNIHNIDHEIEIALQKYDQSTK